MDRKKQFLGNLKSKIDKRSSEESKRAVRISTQIFDWYDSRVSSGLFCDHNPWGKGSQEVSFAPRFRLSGYSDMSIFRLWDNGRVEITVERMQQRHPFKERDFRDQVVSVIKNIVGHVTNDQNPLFRISRLDDDTVLATFLTAVERLVEDIKKT